MTINILYNEKAIEAIDKFIIENNVNLSYQLEIATKNFQYNIESENSFLMICVKNNTPILWFGFHLNEEEKTISTPFFYIKEDIPFIIKGRSIHLASKAFIEITKEFSDYSFFILAIPKVNKIILKLLSPPMEYVGVMPNYFVYKDKREDGFLYWKPSNLQN